MTIQVLDLYQMKPEFLPATLEKLWVYVRPNELSAYDEPEKWTLVCRAFHPTPLHAATVEKLGYRERKMPVGGGQLAKKRYRRATTA